MPNNKPIKPPRSSSFKATRLPQKWPAEKWQDARSGARLLLVGAVRVRSLARNAATQRPDVRRDPSTRSGITGRHLGHQGAVAVRARDEHAHVVGAVLVDPGSGR